MHKPFYPGAPRDIDDAARTIDRLLQREQASRRQSAGFKQVAQSRDGATAPTAEQPTAGWPATHSPLTSAYVRPPDAYAGEGGGYTANRTHAGKNDPHGAIDLATAANSPVYSPIEGTIAHIGWAYKDRKHGLRSIHVVSPDGHKVKVLYVQPTAELAVGQSVTPNTMLGQSQSLQTAFAPKEGGGRMTDHVHMQFFDPDGRRIDPTPWVDLWRRQTDNWERLGRRQMW